MACHLPVGGCGDATEKKKRLTADTSSAGVKTNWFTAPHLVMAHVGLLAFADLFRVKRGALLRPSDIRRGPATDTTSDATRDAHPAQARHAPLGEVMLARRPESITYQEREQRGMCMTLGWAETHSSSEAGVFRSRSVRQLPAGRPWLEEECGDVHVVGAMASAENTSERELRATLCCTQDVMLAALLLFAVRTFFFSP